MGNPNALEKITKDMIKLQELYCNLRYKEHINIGDGEDFGILYQDGEDFFILKYGVIEIRIGRNETRFSITNNLDIEINAKKLIKFFFKHSSKIKN